MTIDTVYSRHGSSWLPLSSYCRTINMTAPELLQLTVDHLVPYWCEWSAPVVDDNEVLVEWIDGDYKRSKLIIGG